MQNADFGQILCRRASTKRRATSKDAQDLKEKSHEKACRDLRRSRGSRGFRAGGVKLTPPPPPVKIGLNDGAATLGLIYIAS